MNTSFAKTFCCLLLCFVLVAALAPGKAHGQVLIGMLLGDKVTSEKFHLGLDIGANFSDLSGIDDTKMRTGLFREPLSNPFIWVSNQEIPSRRPLIIPSGLA